MTNNEKFRKEVREFYKTEEAKHYSTAWIVIDSIGAKYGLDAIDIDNEIDIMAAEDLILEGKCNTLEEAYEILAEEDRRLNESIAEDDWERDQERDHLQSLLQGLDISKMSEKELAEKIEAKDKDTFDKYVESKHISQNDVNHFNAHVCSPWTKYTTTPVAMATYRDKNVERIKLPPFGNYLIASFKGYIKYNNTFMQEKHVHSIDCDSRERGDILKNMDNFVRFYGAIGYIWFKNDRIATKSLIHNFEYESSRIVKTSKDKVEFQPITGSIELFCYIQYNLSRHKVSSSGVVAMNSSDRTNLGCSSSCNLPTSEYDYNKDLNFNCNYYKCKINEQLDKDSEKIKYSFKYEEVANSPIKEVISRYKSQDNSTKDIIYVIINNLTGDIMYDLEQGHTRKQFEYYSKTYRDGKRKINLSKTHKPINVQSTKDAIKELEEIDD